jgi:hypothetical protein
VRDRGGIHNPGHRPVQEVQPACGVSHLLAEEFAGIGNEGSRRSAVQYQFAERAQDQEDEDAADPVDHKQPGPRRREPSSGAEEEAGSDSAAKSDHLQLAVFEGLVIAGVFAREPLGGGV